MSTGRADSHNNRATAGGRRTVGRANERIAEHGGCEPLPGKLSPHALRRTFASWLIGAGDDVAYVMDQLGHTDPKMTLGVYANVIRTGRPASRATPAPAPEWASTGTPSGSDTERAPLRAVS